MYSDFLFSQKKYFLPKITKILSEKYKTNIMSIGLGDVFETAEDLVANQEYALAQTAVKVKPKNCAHFLDLPQLPREDGLFIGLKNQGATCYLNSLI